MKLSILPLLAFASVVIAAPVPVAEPEASPGYGRYAGYGTYPPPKGGYGKYSGYGSYKRAEDKVEKRDYADYGAYEAPPGGYGSYDAVSAPAAVPAPAAGYGDYPAPVGGYGDYPAPAGGYGSYGSYKRAILDFVKRVWN